MSRRDIVEALTDPHLIGAALEPIEDWRNWLAIWKASFGLADMMTDDEREFFKRVAGGRSVPKTAPRRLTITSGRRSGKSRQTAAIGVALALYADRSKLAPGETGYVMILAPTKEQSAAIFDYALAFLETSPILKREIENVTREEIRLRGNTAIIVQAADSRTVRSKSLLGALIDEGCFLRDTNDKELWRAIQPAMLTTNGVWISISSAGRKSGLQYERWRDHYGKDSPDDLVIQATTNDLNLTIDRSTVDALIAEDPEAGNSEYLSAWRQDLAALFPDDVIDRAIVSARPEVLPYDPAVKRYVAGVDMSAGRHDASVLCIGHVDKDRFITDGIFWRPAPHDPASVAKEFADLCREYRISEITGDNFAGSWVSNAFQGLRYHKSPKDRSRLYLEALPVFMQGRVEIPDSQSVPTVRELKNLERRLATSGRESVDHPRHGSDDAANALALAMYVALKGGARPKFALAAPSFCVGGMWSSSPISHADHDPASFGATIAR